MSARDVRLELRRILALAQTPEDLDCLLDALLTPQETEQLVKRWLLFRGLAREQPQRDIARELGVSLGKIARGSRLLKYGAPRFRRLVERAAAAGEAPPA
jgi:TrpR family trp operon transcriptional repressor